MLVCHTKSTVCFFINRCNNCITYLPVLNSRNVFVWEYVKLIVNLFFISSQQATETVKKHRIACMIDRIFDSPICKFCEYFANSQYVKG